MEKEVKFQRSFEHVDGNWPSHVYIQVENSQKMKLLQRMCLSHFDSTCRDSTSKLVVESTKHISLSRPFVLRYHQIELFVDLLGKTLSIFKKFFCGLASQYEFLANDNRTRLFMCIPVDDRPQKLAILTQAIDDTLARFGQETYYTSPKFHVSVASMLSPNSQVDSESDKEPKEGVREASWADRTVTVGVTHVVPRGYPTKSIKVKGSGHKGEGNGHDKVRAMVMTKSMTEAASDASEGGSNCDDDNDAISDEDDEDGNDDEDDGSDGGDCSNPFLLKSDGEPLNHVLEVQYICCKVGNRLFRFALSEEDGGETVRKFEEFQETVMSNKKRRRERGDDRAV